MSDLFRFAQLQPYTLAGAGAVIGDTSIILKSMTDIDGNALSMSGTFGDIGFGTLSPGSGTLEEQICFTGLTNNSNGTVTLSGVKSVAFVYPYTQTTGLLKTHAGASPFIISNTAGFYDKLTSKADDETITGKWTFTQSPIVPDPTLPTDAANKEYVDNVIVAGAPNADDYTKGIVQLATRVQMAAGTALGTTGAHLVLTSERATATGASGTTVVVVTQSNGTIAPAFIDGTGNYTFTGTTTLAGLNFITGTTTITGVIQPITQTAGALVQYTSNSQYPAQNGELITKVEKMVQSTPSDQTTSSTTEKTIASYVVPANTLVPNRAIRIKTAIAMSAVGTMTFKLKYGSTTVISQAVTIADSNTSSIPTGNFEAILYANGSTTSQYGVLTGFLIGNGGSSTFNVNLSHGVAVSGTASVDASTSTTVALTITSGSSVTATMYGASVEVI